jgi:5-formyltetrahydrofolate cyclo-ligase
MISKKEYRNLVKENIKKVNPEILREKSEKILRLLETNPRFISSKTIMPYWSMDSEVQTHLFIKKWSKKKLILLPCIVKDNLVVKKYIGTKSMIKTPPFGIMESTGEEYKGKIDLVIVPGIAFDKQNNRIGHGKGYYDRFLKNAHTYKIGICFDFQLFDEIPSGENDVRMDEVMYK